MSKSKVSVKKARLKSSTIIIIGLLLCLAVGLALAAGDTMPRTLIDSGGGALEQSDIRLQSSIGQPIVGTVSQEMTLCSGYYCGPGVAAVAKDYAIYLPVIVR